MSLVDNARSPVGAECIINRTNAPCKLQGLPVYCSLYCPLGLLQESIKKRFFLHDKIPRAESSEQSLIMLLDFCSEISFIGIQSCKVKTACNIINLMASLSLDAVKDSQSSQMPSSHILKIKNCNVENEKYMKI